MSSGVVSRRRFIGLAAGFAGAAALPLPRALVALSAPPVECAVAPAAMMLEGVYQTGIDLSAQGRLDRAVTMCETWMAYEGKKYVHTRFLSDSGIVLDEKVREARPFEEFMLVRLNERTRRP